MRDRHSINRRCLLKTAAGALAMGAVSAPRARAQSDRRKPDPRAAARLPAGRFKKAVKFTMIKLDGTIADKFQLLKDLGYDGVDMNGDHPENIGEILAARDKVGLPIHGVVNGDHWKLPLSHPDPKVREQCVESIKASMREAGQYGATGVLVVPAKVDATMPYDAAYTRSQAEIRKLIPLAEELDVRILIENVWNNFLLSPLELARYIDEFESPMVGSYFDVGNVVRSGWPEHWIRILGPRIVKLDIKEYSRIKRDKEGLYKGFDVELGEGDCNWPEVMKALADIGFGGWGTAEVPGGDRARLQDIARRMDMIFAIKPAGA